MIGTVVQEDTLGVLEHRVRNGLVFRRGRDVTSDLGSLRSGRRELGSLAARIEPGTSKEICSSFV